MSKDRLMHSGESSDPASGQNPNDGSIMFNTRSENSQPLAAENNNNQQLRIGNDDTANLYKSEEHRQVYQNTSQSFNEQRDAYAEQAMNAPVQAYDYQAVNNAGDETAAELRRYHSAIDYIHDPVKNTDFSNSIFTSSDYELANATGNYLQKDSEKYKQKLDKTEGKLQHAKGKVNHLETHRLEYRNSYKIWKHKLVLEKDEDAASDYAGSWHTKGLFHKDVIHKEQTTRIVGRLKFRSEKIALTAGKHRRRVRKAEYKYDRRTFLLRKSVSNVKGSIKESASGSEFQEDEIAAEMNRKLKRIGKELQRGAAYSLKKDYRKLKHELDGYGRLQFQKSRLNSLQAQKKLLSYQSGIDLQKRKAEEAARQGLIRESNKRKIRKEMVQSYKRESGSFLTRMRNQHNMKKTVKKEQKMIRKQVKTIVKALIGALSVILVFLFLVVFFTCLLLDILGESSSNTVSQNDYSDMTGVTAYFREKEADLAEYIKPENLEEIIKEDVQDEYPNIYEFEYNMAEISFDSNTLVAYLSARYNEFDLDMVKDDLDEIFEQYYTLSWEVEEEYRNIPGEGNRLVQICYVTLEKADFYELLKSRIEDPAKQNQMDSFYLSGNGQQVYGPVMDVDWRNKISSNFGWRIHPITGVRTFHDGVDIAVPTGTALYSAVEGTVTVSKYSDSAGNMITVRKDSGWEITFMHMDSRAISVGDKVEQGQYVGTSGNTGNSTGPHLHIQVHDPEGNEINPVFIIPYSTLEASESFNTGGND